MVNDEIDLKNIFKYVGIFFLVIFGIVILFNSFFTVQPNERAMIYSWNGGLKSEVYSEGLHFKIPIVNSVIKMNTQVQKQSEDASAATSDLQDVKTTVAVNFKIDPSHIQDIYRQIGQSTVTEDYMQINIINPIIQESVKMATAKYTASDLIKNRESVKSMIDQRITERLASYNLVVTDVSITNFEFSPTFTSAIEAKVTAEQNALTEENKVQIAKFQADQKVATATGDANAVKINADAQAYSLQVIREQLEKNNALIQYKYIEKWNGVVPQYQLGGATPLISIPSTN